MADNDQVKRIIPQNSLEVDIMTTNPVWGVGGSEINPKLKEQLKTLYAIAGEKEGEVSTKEKDLWSLLGFFNRDIRLSNFTSGDIKDVRHSLVLAGHLLEQGHKENFVIELMKVATLCETSQGRGGFLRKRTNTITKEESNLEPPKKSLFGKNKGNNGGGY